MNIISNTMKRTLSIMFNPRRRAPRFIIDIITSYIWFFYASLKVVKIAKKKILFQIRIISLLLIKILNSRNSNFSMLVRRLTIQLILYLGL